MQNQTNPKPLGAPMAKLVLVAAIIVSLGAVAGVAGYLAKNKAVKISQPQVLPAAEQEAANQIIDETADWQTYRNEEYGLEVKYPEDFECRDYSYEESETNPLIFRRNCQGFFIQDQEGEKFMLSGVDIYTNKEMLSLFDWIVKNRLKNIPVTFEYPSLAKGEITTTPFVRQTITISEIITSNYQGIRVKDVIEGGFSDEVYFIKNDRIYKIGRYDPFIVPKYQETFNQMLSTFRFLDWQLFSIEEYGFFMKIHPNYKKTREEELQREGLKMKIVVFSKDGEKVGITIDREPDTIKMIRAILIDALNLGPEEWQKSLEYYSNLGLIESGAEFVSKENIEIGTCIGIQLLEKKEQKYKRNLILTSRNLENMYVTILFEYSTKDTESEILKMIETIECTK
ncbi:hypothetical protein KKB43_04480 [Patescibacteria group bacterium]|nr:hypothetical protein [Patescibacteria group bacterium]MBU4580244.1 hypothetical protein [Patescibacteria group bacterium]